MTILPVSQSKLSSSRSSLPLLQHPLAIPPLSSCGAGVGPFTSQYMVSHLQDLAPQHQEQGTVQGGREGRNIIMRACHE